MRRQLTLVVQKVSNTLIQKSLVDHPQELLHYRLFEVVVVARKDSSSDRSHWSTCRDDEGLTLGSCAQPSRTSSGQDPGSHPLHWPRLLLLRPLTWSLPNQQGQIYEVDKSSRIQYPLPLLSLQNKLNSQFTLKTEYHWVLFQSFEDYFSFLCACVRMGWECGEKKQIKQL